MRLGGRGLRKQKLWAGLATVFAVVAVGVLATAARADPTLLSHNARWLTDRSGRVVILHGVGVMDYSPPNLPAAMGFGDKDAAFLAAHGINLVRVGMNWSGIEPRPGVFDQSYLNSILGTVRTLAAHRIYSLLDWHQDDWGVAAAGIDGAPAWATLTDGLPNPALGYGVGMLADPAQQRAFDNFWANSAGPGGIGITDRFAAMLADYGRAFRDQPYVLGYDTFNEPNAGTQWPSCANPAGCPLFDAKLSAWYRHVIPALRATDPLHLIWYEPNVFFDFAANTNLAAPAGGDPNTGFDFHTYCLGDGAAAALPSLPGNGPGCAVEEQLNLDNALAYGRRSGAALLDSEWGATNDPTVVTRQTDEFDRYMLGDVFWDYRNLVHDVSAPPDGANVDAALVNILDRPYPQAIGGTPTAWKWDASTRTFSLDYSTTLPNGRAATGLETDVYVPPLHFPTGYRVYATGATVVSPADASILRLQAVRGARAVGLKVMP